MRWMVSLLDLPKHFHTIDVESRPLYIKLYIVWVYMPEKNPTWLQTPLHLPFMGKGMHNKLNSLLLHRK